MIFVCVYFQGATCHPFGGGRMVQSQIGDKLRGTRVLEIATC